MKFCSLVLCYHQVDSGIKLYQIDNLNADIISLQYQQLSIFNVFVEPYL
jgi:hypothetical protein